MGIIKRGILGGVANKIGNVVGSSWKGIATLRSLPLSVANPNTQLQRKNRDSFSIMSKLGSQVLATVCQPLWNRDAKQMSGFNAYVMYNKGAFDVDPIAWLLNPIMSKGSLSADLLNAALVSGGGNIELTFATAVKNPQDLQNDVAYVQVLHKGEDEQGKTFYEAKAFVTNAKRSAGQVIVPNPFEVSTGHTLAVSLSFKSADGRDVATSSTRIISIIE